MLLKTFIKHREEYQGEAILEFLYALSIGKLCLFKDHYRLLLDDLDKIEDERIKGFTEHIKIVYENRF